MRKRLLLVDPLFHPKGGGAAVTFWALEGLKHAYDVSLLAWGPVDTAEGNRLFGTALQPGDFRRLSPPPPVRWAGELARHLDADPWSIQRWALLLRQARLLAPRYDVVLTTNGEADFGAPGIQYVHYPYLADAAHRQLRPRSAWRRPWQVVSGFRYTAVPENLTLVNSDWTGAVYRSHYGAPALTVYPPVPGPFPAVPWEDREDGFVCVGRYNGDKRLDLIIDAVAAVRERHPHFHLHVVGTPMPEEVGGAAYYARLRRRAAANAAWLHLDEGLSREAMLALLARHRYGIHAKRDEHFGIGVAEMVKAGCVTFAHRSGGQVEIIADDRLLYDADADAARQALRVIERPAERRALRAHLRRRARLFSADRFVASLRAHVAAFLAR